MHTLNDGPVSDRFFSLALDTGQRISDLESLGFSSQMVQATPHAPQGQAAAWGIPFEIKEVVPLVSQPTQVRFPPFQAGWLVFMHTSDIRPLQPGPGGFISPMRGEGQLGEHAADYIVVYTDGTEERAAIRRRHQVGAFTRHWGENCFEAVVHAKPRPVRPPHEQLSPDWGFHQTRVSAMDWGEWVNWLWAWANPHPEKAISAIRFEPINGALLLSAISAGNVSDQPLRWLPRRKALLHLPPGTLFQPELDERGLLNQIQLDLGQVISAAPRPVYPRENWEESYLNQVPILSNSEVLIEFTAHPDACFHLLGGQNLPVYEVTGGTTVFDSPKVGSLQPVNPAIQRVTLRVVGSDGRSVPVKLHMHGEWGEYLAPVDRHRILNPAWFEDYSVDFFHRELFPSTYIPGETRIDLPVGKVFLEVTKGFEIRPLRRMFNVTPEVNEITLEIEKVLPWREKGWITADTHVHFLSPVSALLEGAAEGVNVVNLLASQWGELKTNVGDFDGTTTWGSREAGGNGEYVVRVGTENRQHILGHISLLGYKGNIIAPMTTGGPDESALGDPIEILLTEWARQCKQQAGLVVLPHFPHPRAEHAASIVLGEIDAVEMTSWGDLYAGISPYSLADWYRYLNCGYQVPAVGGTDKMAAETAVGTVRTYAHLRPGESFTYPAWMDAIKRKETFVSYGPLLEFSVEGHPMGSYLEVPHNGATLDVQWEVASVTVPVSRVELVVNGEIRESLAVPPGGGSGHWTFKADRSCWLALLVRGHHPDKPEIITAHSSPVMVVVAGSHLLPYADAVTILEQIEGTLAYLDTVGTRAEDLVYKRMRLVIESAHRSLHNRMHQAGYFHEHALGEPSPGG